jgi:hypothetical protein
MSDKRSQRFSLIHRKEIGLPDRAPTPAGCDPEIIDTADGVIIAWSDGKKREQRRLPAGTPVVWHDGAFRVGFFKDMPQPRSAGV